MRYVLAVGGLPIDRTRQNLRYNRSLTTFSILPRMSNSESLRKSEAGRGWPYAISTLYAAKSSQSGMAMSKLGGLNIVGHSISSLAAISETGADSVFRPIPGKARHDLDIWPDRHTPSQSVYAAPSYAYPKVTFPSSLTSNPATIPSPLNSSAFLKYCAIKACAPFMPTSLMFMRS